MPPPALANTALQVASDVLTAKQLKAAYEEATGNSLAELRLS